jgi:hypothetical protein
MGGRNIYISMLVFVGILLPAGLLLKGSNAALVAFEVLAFAAGFRVLHVLDGRQQRREEDGD